MRLGKKKRIEEKDNRTVEEGERKRGYDNCKKGNQKKRT